MQTTTPRSELRDRFVRARARTRALFDLLDGAAYYERPIPLRNPIVFYEGHLPAFAVNTLLKRALGRPGIDDRLERIFARGIDPDSEAAAVARGNPFWPSRDAVRAYAEAADRLIEETIATGALDGRNAAAVSLTQAIGTVLEHEEMHQETLAYMWHQLPYAWKRKPEHYVTAPPRMARPSSPRTRIRIPAGTATLGTDLGSEDFAWDNELPPRRVAVDAFEIDAHDVTNQAFMTFVQEGGYRDRRWWRDEDWAWVTAARVTHPPFWECDDGRWHWRGMFERVALPDDWPVYVTWAEAQAYARWSGGRLPTEAEFHRAAFGTPDAAERRFPWGETLEGRPPANFDFMRWDPEPAGARPGGASAFGVHDLVGNGWEWTATAFGPFPGFTAMPAYPEYSADFFDEGHFVLKGASPVTARTLVRRGLRNWFRPHYPYVYASFRCVRPAGRD